MPKQAAKTGACAPISILISARCAAIALRSDAYKSAHSGFDVPMTAKDKPVGLKPSNRWDNLAHIDTG